MAYTTEQSIIDNHGETDFATDVADMVADHAPRRFAVVLEYGDQIDAEIVAWGFELDDGAYMATVDGKNQYAMTAPESALRYVNSRPNTTAHLVWVDGEAAE